MPVIVVGADTEAGMRIIRAFTRPGREVRAFVTDPEVGSELRRLQVKVALGDVSDDSHVGAAATGCFSAVLVTEAASDDRERSFARGPEEVLEGWSRAVSEAGVRRAIWVSAGSVPETRTRESTVVDPTLSDLPEVVFGLDDAQSI
jgi:nucleoside-diphosphate-sugar epimerase